MNPKRRKMIQQKRKKLIVVFSLSFILLFVFFSWLGSVITPDMNNPILENDNTESFKISSNEFKGRVDSRLKLIEMNDDNPSSEKDEDQEEASTDSSDITNEVVSPFKESETSQETKDQTLVQAIDTENDEFFKNHEEEPFLDEEESQEIVLNSTDEEKEETTPVVQLQRPSAPPVPVLRKRIHREMVKVLVGSYKNREDAEKAAQLLARKYLDEVPFIKEINGRYALQAGSFANPQMARDFARGLKEEKLYVRIVKE